MFQLTTLCNLGQFRRFEDFCLLLAGLLLLRKMESMFFPETLGSISTTRRFNPEFPTVHIHRCEDLPISHRTLLKLETDIVKRPVMPSQNPRSHSSERLNKTLIYKAS